MKKNKLYNNKTMSMNSIYILTEKLIKIVTYFFSGLIIAREAGPYMFGTYSSILSVTIILSAISALGLNSLLAKEFINKENKIDDILSNALLTRVFSCCIFSFAAFPISYYVLKVDSTLSLLSSIIVMTSVSQVIDIFFESRLRSVIVAKYKSIAYLTGFALKVISVTYFSSAYSIIVAHILEMSLLLMLSVYFLKSSNDAKVRLSAFSVSYSKKLLKIGSPLMLSSIASIVYMKIDQVFIVALLDKESVGYYSAAVRLCEGLFIISAVIVPSLFPNMLSLYNSSKEKFNRFIGNVFFFLLAIGVLISIPVYLLSDSIIHILYGDEYINSSDVLMWYCLSIPLIYIGDLFSRWIIVTDNIMLSLQRHLLGLTVNTVMNFILIPTYGIEGAAIASFLGYTSSILIFSILSSKGRCFYNFMRV
ncbi:flippase [Vibrio vulnificus]|uniref:flippase n=1 Tax=Vibrio vulnificus TaxID=672 RepID=UPI0011151FB9|nr:flippase [Vibrio vulnificus]